ncbi:MAG TPA: hypothetical protein VFN49_05555, partial [Candidatus Aquilonibacter sp.]|nr:hypothetical protein [Candidatus Aquilonibacter sp.]
MRRTLAFACAIALAATGFADARPGGGGRGASRPAPSRPAPSRPAPSRPAPSRPAQMPSGGFSGFNGDFSGRQPVAPPGTNRPPATRPDRPPPQPRPPRPPIPPPVPPRPPWGWNGGVIWVPAPYYYGGGFWGPFAWGATTAIVLGAVIDDESHEEVKSYQVAPDSPGAKVLQAYHLQQVECKSSGVVVIYGPQQSV